MRGSVLFGPIVYSRMAYPLYRWGSVRSIPEDHEMNIHIFVLMASTMKVILTRSLRKRDELAVREVSKQLAERVLDVVDKGLCSGAGQPIPGRMCVEAAVCYAMGQQHSDEPSCVHGNVRAAKIALNDQPWSSRKARAKGMRRLAVAQLGSNGINGNQFNKRLSYGLISLILPDALKESKRQEENSLLKKMSRAREGAWRGLLLSYKEKHGFHGGSLIRVLHEIAEDLHSSSAYRSESLILLASRWSGKAKNGKARDARLRSIADVMEKALVGCRSKGRAWLSLCDD